MKVMETKIENFACACIGIYITIRQYILNIHLETDFWSKAIGGILLSFLGGAACWAGKEVMKVGWRSLAAYFKKSKSKNDVGQNQ